MIVPVLVVDLLLAETLFSVRPFEEAGVSGGSGSARELDGTRDARSGGWSFPTDGLACNKTIRLDGMMH